MVVAFKQEVTIMNQISTKTTKQTNRNPKTRQVTKQQLLILNRIYQFRFVSTYQIQQLLGKKQIQQAQQRLNLLLSRGWIGRNFTKSDRLTGRFASYYLLPPGLKILRQNNEDKTLNEKVLRNIYKDKSASKRFIDHCLAVGDINLHLIRLNGDSIKFINKSQLAYYDYLPRPLPDGFVKIKQKSSNLSDIYFLEYFEQSVPFFVHRKRIKQYIEYMEEGYWQSENEGAHPHNRFVAETEALQKRIKRFTGKFLADYYYDYEPIVITNLNLLKTTEDPAIWYLINEAVDN